MTTDAKKIAIATIAKWAKDYDVMNDAHLPETVWRVLETRIADAMVQYADKGRQRAK